jgi:hypothetical protein
MRCNVAGIGERFGACRVFVGNLRKINYVKDLGICGRIVKK